MTDNGSQALMTDNGSQVFTNGTRNDMNGITKRLLTQLGDMELVEKFVELPNSDFNSLMLKIFQSRASKLMPVDMVKAFQANRFSVPSELNPVAYHDLETEFLSSAQEFGIKPVLLSPSAPFASSSVFGCVNQNNVVSAVRGTEILSDPTNMLSIIIADKLKNKKADNTMPIHYCATARVVRAQSFPNTDRHFTHFGIFCIVSSGKDSGSYGCESAMLQKQLSFFKKLLLDKYDANLSIVLRKRLGYSDADGFFNRMAELVKDEFPGVPLSLDTNYENNNYYKGINYGINMDKDGNQIEIGDGGFVDWMQSMTSNKKERCLISGIGLDRLLLL